LGHNTARPDILAADEAQPVEALLVGQADAVRRLIHVCPQASIASLARTGEAISGFCPSDHYNGHILTAGMGGTRCRLPQTKLRECEITYAKLAKRFRRHGFKEETEASITNKLARGTFPATFFLACLAALELDGVALEEI
jgi:hypothetical protein